MNVLTGTRNDENVLVSVDVEAGGPVPGIYPLLAIGACLVEGQDDRFYAELRPVCERVDPTAVAVGWPAARPEETLARLERDGEMPEEAFPRFAAWLAKRQQGRRLVYVALNAAFDWAFTHYWFARLKIDDPFGFAPLDIKSYWDSLQPSKLPVLSSFFVRSGDERRI